MGRRQGSFRSREIAAMHRLHWKLKGWQARQALSGAGRGRHETSTQSEEDAGEASELTQIHELG